VPPALAAGRRRPDPALGVFDTLLVLDGVPQRLDAHLARLERSLAEVYDRALPDDLRARVHDLARSGRDRARLRIDAVPGKDFELVLTPARRRTLPIVLHPYTLPGGLGAHKWRDRELIDALVQTPLFLDADGTVLEAGWANVLIRRGDRLLRPRADGRILPGTSLPRAEEADLTLADLRAADRIMLSSALSGVVTAVLADAPAEAHRPTDSAHRRIA
jgi:para-aminobenzoate synthetase/4-amino-4-deoxychorismate lyase